MNETLRQQLLALESEDLRVREDLAREDLLGDGYHPRMEAVHRHNAEQLERIVAEHGWPGRTLAGADGAEAAWRILQHAIGRPDLQRGCLPLIEQAAAAGEIPAWHPAYLLDRIRFYEGKPQVYGTQYSWDNEGFSALWTVENPAGLQERRKSVGLPPLSDEPSRTRVQKPVPPEQAKARREAMEAWARSVGWRD